MDETDDAIIHGSGNVFADLGYPDAKERQTKLRLALAINAVIGRRRLTQTAAAEKLGVNQPKVSALANHRLDGFSVERLMTFLTALDQDVQIVIRKSPAPARRRGYRWWREGLSRDSRVGQRNGYVARRQERENCQSSVLDPLGSEPESA